MFGCACRATLPSKWRHAFNYPLVPLRWKFAPVHCFGNFDIYTYTILQWPTLTHTLTLTLSYLLDYLFQYFPLHPSTPDDPTQFVLLSFKFWNCAPSMWCTFALIYAMLFDLPNDWIAPLIALTNIRPKLVTAGKNIDRRSTEYCLEFFWFPLCFCSVYN